MEDQSSKPGTTNFLLTTNASNLAGLVDHNGLIDLSSDSLEDGSQQNSGSKELQLSEDYSNSRSDSGKKCESGDAVASDDPKSQQDLNFVAEHWSLYCNRNFDVRDIGIGKYFLEKDFNINSGREQYNSHQKLIKKWNNMLQFGKNTSASSNKAKGDAEKLNFSQSAQEQLSPLKQNRQTTTEDEDNKKYLEIFKQRRSNSFYRQLRKGVPMLYRWPA